MVDKIQIQSQQQFDVAIGSIVSAMQIMSTFDWDHICQSMEVGSSFGAMVDPKVKNAIEADPQWEAKKRIFKAARSFVTEVEGAAAEL